VENRDGNPNVYALFPGIDTAPFGATAGEDPGGADDGWSAVPARTVAADEIAAPAGSIRARAKLSRVGLQRRTPAIGLVGLALLVGAALAVAQTAISPAHREPRLAAEHAARGSERDLAQIVGKLLEAASIKPERASVRDRSAGLVVRARTRGRHRGSAPVRTVTVTAVHSSPSAPTPQQPPPHYVTAAGSTGSEGSGSRVQNSASSTAQRAGPSGPVSLIGAGTTPSG